jgi:NOL1/NOP2/sun family putative RNA methylase
MTASAPIPPLFLDRMERWLGDEFPAFASALENEPLSGLRVNTLKLSAEEFQAIAPFPLGERVPWEPAAFLLPSAPASPGLHPYHLAGLYYLQDPSAMSAVVLLDPQPGERILDLAAAPGGKTTHLAARMQGRGLLVANEIKDKRLGHLAMNVERWGAGNIAITNETPERLADHFGPFFDRVLVDAPCSGEGMFRKDAGARLDWSPEMVTGCAVRQRNILRVAAKLVRPGGYLLYSTCTFAPEENEGVLAEFLQAFPDFEVTNLPFFPGFARGRPEWLNLAPEMHLEKAVRLFPHRIAGEGHFVCRLRRRGEEMPFVHKARLTGMSALQARLWHDFAGETLAVNFPDDRLRVRGERLYFIPEDLPDFGPLRLVHPGVWLGTFKTGRFEPAHPLALFLRPGEAQRTLNLPAESPALAAYLRGEPLPSPGDAGWMLVTVDGWPLGWGKQSRDVLKNHFPRGWMQA